MKRNEVIRSRIKARLNKQNQIASKITSAFMLQSKKSDDAKLVYFEAED